jgi:hypothetical protein
VSGGTSRVTPPSVGDVLLAARAYGWPAVQGDGVAIAPGEAGWRAAVTPETALLVWETLHEADLVDDPDDEP